MRICDLFEQADSQPVQILRTKRFTKEAAKLLDTALEEKLAAWLQRKIFSSQRLLGTDDRPGRYKLAPWNHLHLKHGTVLVHYLGLKDKIVLASVTDHKSVDGGTDENAQLIKYLKSVHVPSLEAPAEVPTDPVPASVLTSEQRMAAQNLVYDLAVDAKERPNLEKFVSDNDFDAVEEWFVLSDLPTTTQAQQTYIKLAQTALSRISVTQ
jgi:hypothetical protein